MFQGGVRGQDRVVGLHHRRRNLRRRINRKFELRLFAIIAGKPLHEKRSETGTCPAAKGMKDEKALQPRALVSQLANSVARDVDEFSTDRVVSTGVVVRRVLFTRNELLGMEQLAICSVPHFVHHRRLQIDKDGTGDVLPASCLGEKRVERVVQVDRRVFGGDVTVGLDAMLKTVQFPTRVA